MITLGLFKNFVEFGVQDKEDIEHLNTQLGSVLKQLKFNNTCDECGKVFKTQRQLKSHKKKHMEEE